MAMDTLYITSMDGKKIENPVPLKQIEAQFTALVSRPESTD
jgi:hypothetical protein